MLSTLFSPYNNMMYIASINFIWDYYDGSINFYTYTELVTILCRQEIVFVETMNISEANILFGRVSERSK